MHHEQGHKSTFKAGGRRPPISQDLEAWGGVTCSLVTKMFSKTQFFSFF